MSTRASALACGALPASGWTHLQLSQCGVSRLSRRTLRRVSNGIGARTPCLSADHQGISTHRPPSPALITLEQEKQHRGHQATSKALVGRQPRTGSGEDRGLELGAWETGTGIPVKPRGTHTRPPPPSGPPDRQPAACQPPRPCTPQGRQAPPAVALGSIWFGLLHPLLHSSSPPSKLPTDPTYTRATATKHRVPILSPSAF